MAFEQKPYSDIELKTGGLFLAIGALITLVSILLEINAGWASFSVDIERTDYDAGLFLFKNWPTMKSIWSFALFGNVILAIAALLLQKNSRKIGIFPESIFWHIYFIGNLLLILSFGLCLGSYYPALEVLEQQPAMFSAVRGAPLYLFNLGAVSGLVLPIIFFYEGFSKHGIVPRKWAMAMLFLIIVAIIVIIAGLSSSVVAMVIIFIPVLLGICYWKNASKYYKNLVLETD